MAGNRRSIVITGASAGVGRAITLRLAGPDTALALLARDADALEDVAREVRARGGQALVLPCDVASGDAVAAAGRAATEAHGRIDVWINVAMAAVFGTVDQITPEEVRRVTEVTYLGFVNGTMAALRDMRTRERGTIVQIGSALAYRGIPLQSAYCGAKHAIRGFTASLRCELAAAGSGIAITELHLPAVNTPQFDWARTHRDSEPRPAGPVYQPEAIAEAVASAIDRPAREYWLGRQGPLLIMGNQVWPGLLDRLMAKSGIEGQSTEQPVKRDQPDNLFTPVPGLHRTRGRFGQEAAARVPTFDARLVRASAISAALIVAGMLGFALGAAFI
ncbi:Short-chain dehydrogenase [Citreimonas salinaria]|uniref:Short-chain dehydrogenase n=2 Tax=Citreimonas salinaria TaxID=321339 RepID=A0A1H3NEQ6_9RHOB|nr:Short-chain dehydrogenase [Citreimonas salinaria]